uniref:Protein MAM3 n=1 Tax=Lygus hesperus TaxID=30085 RepID=A0A0A9XXG1_LYGHE
MSICNNQKYALFVGSYTLPILQISLVLLYPVAKPLAMLLDYMVHHKDGMVYDKQELKKLLRLHCEKYADKSGMDVDQMKMILSALELNEVTVNTVMTSIDEVYML